MHATSLRWDEPLELEDGAREALQLHHRPVHLGQTGAQLQLGLGSGVA